MLPDPDAHELSSLERAFVLAIFGIAAALAIRFFAASIPRDLDLLLAAASLGAIGAAGAWLWILAARRSRGWAVAFLCAAPIPYVNFLVASWYARRYWNDGGRAPAILAMVGFALQTAATLHIVLAPLGVPV